MLFRSSKIKNWCNCTHRAIRNFKNKKLYRGQYSAKSDETDIRDDLVRYCQGRYLEGRLVLTLHVVNDNHVVFEIGRASCRERV